MNIYWEEHEVEWLEEIIIAKPTQEAGGYDITGGGDKAHSIIFNMTKKPKWFHRFCAKLFLGWVWVDKKD